MSNGSLNGQNAAVLLPISFHTSLYFDFLLFWESWEKIKSSNEFGESASPEGFLWLCRCPASKVNKLMMIRVIVWLFILWIRALYSHRSVTDYGSYDSEIEEEIAHRLHGSVFPVKRKEGVVDLSSDEEEEVIHAALDRFITQTSPEERDKWSLFTFSFYLASLIFH